jgi:hypothetical protein
MLICAVTAETAFCSKACCLPTQQPLDHGCCIAAATAVKPMRPLTAHSCSPQPTDAARSSLLQQAL